MHTISCILVTRLTAYGSHSAWCAGDQGVSVGGFSSPVAVATQSFTFLVRICMHACIVCFHFRFRYPFLVSVSIISVNYTCHSVVHCGL